MGSTGRNREELGNNIGMNTATHIDYKNLSEIYTLENVWIG